jgi:hypothetical protein
MRNLFACATVALLVLTIANGCSVILRHTLNVSATPNIEAVSLPSNMFVIGDTTAGGTPSDKWVMITSLKAGTIRSTVAPNGFDLSPILRMDPFTSVWAPPLPTAQAIFVPGGSYARLKIDPDEWDQRFVIQLIINRGPEREFGTDEAERLASQDPARAICRNKVTRRLVSVAPGDLVYESHFKGCPDFGWDRVVLTRESFANWANARGSQAIFSFSYESLGDRLSPEQKAEALKLIWAPRLTMQEPQGEKHPLLLNEQLHFVVS